MRAAGYRPASSWIALAAAIIFVGTALTELD